MELHAPTCTLRTYRDGDAESLSRNGNDRRVWLNLRDRFPHPYRLADGERYIAYVLTQDRPTSFAIEVDGEAVGGIALHPGSDIERIGAELGYWIGPAYWGRGIVSDAVRLITAHALHTLDFHRVFALPFTRNAASARVLEKARYVLEGTLRSNAMKDGEILDQYVYATVRA